MYKKNIRFYEFDKFRADVRNCALSYEEQPVRITKKTFDLLLLLLENSDREVSRNEIMEKLWSPTADPNNLDQYLSKLRTLLGDKDEAGSEQKNRFIKTFPSQGIKFVMPVIEVLEENQTDTSTEEFNVATSAGEVGNVQSARRKLSASLVGFIAVAILLMTGFFFGKGRVRQSNKLRQMESKPCLQLH